jgi:hypothetical protein
MAEGFAEKFVKLVYEFMGEERVFIIGSISLSRAASRTIGGH